MNQKLVNTEKSLFSLVFLLHLLPVVVLTPFVTLDGPAHLYNAGLMKSLLLDHVPVINSFFEFNSFPEPNWSGHAIMMTLLFFLPPLITEKAMIFLILILTAIGYRKLVIAIDPSKIWLSWLVFPFLYNFTFLLGFFNFAFAMALLPWWMAWWLNHHNKTKSIQQFCIVFLIFILLYFSHLVVFLLAGFSAGIISLLSNRKRESPRLKSEFAFLLLVSLPGLILTVLFLFVFGTEGYRGEITRLPISQLFSDLLNSRMFIVYDYTTEKRATIGFTLLMLLLTFVGFRNKEKNNDWEIYLIQLLGAFALIFILPDSLASGGILSVRLIQWFFMIWCLWLVTMKLPNKIAVIAAILSACFSLGMMRVHWKVQQELSETATGYIEIANTLEKNQIVLPLNYSTNWLHSNMVCYVGALKQVVVLDNYEATQHHFPIVWKKNMDPEIHMGNQVSSNRPCVQITRSEKFTGLKVQYAVALNRPLTPEDSCTTNTFLQLEELYSKSDLPNTVNPELFIRK